MEFNFRSQAAQKIAAVKTQFQGIQSRCQAKLQAIKTQVKTVAKTQFQGIQSRLKSAFQATKSRIETISQTLFRWLRLQLSAFTKLSPQSTLLKLVAVTAAAVMVGLVIGGIQFLLRGNPVSDAKTVPAIITSPSPSPAPPPNWAGLPIVPTAKPQPPQANQPSPSPANPSALAESVPEQPTAKAVPPKTATKFAPAPQPTPPQPAPAPSVQVPQPAPGRYMPPQEYAPADPSNYGDRYGQDVFGNPVQNDPVIVLHETVGSADSAINMFRTAHSDESLQASYHSIIRLDGTIVYLVPSNKRAFGAGNSVFVSNKGQEAVRTHKQFPPSVNNFAYHISLETPPDGDNMAETHSGYTEAQYRSLAWLVANSSVPDERITTHRDIDRSESRIDPRSFDRQKFLTYLHVLRGQR